MVTVTKERLARDLAVRLQTDPEQAVEMVDQIFATIRRHLRAGNAVEIDDLCSIAVSNQALLREDESGGLAAYAPGPGALEVTPVGSFKKDLAHLHPTSIYYLGQGNDIDVGRDFTVRTNFFLIVVTARRDNFLHQRRAVFQRHAEGTVTWETEVRTADLGDIPAAEYEEVEAEAP